MALKSGWLWLLAFESFEGAPVLIRLRPYPGADE
jgi:hypothetical protein